jgi:hypothetical protein
MALLGQGFEDPRSAAVMALAGGLLRGDFGGGLLGANQAYAQVQDGAMKRQLAQAQLEETQAQAAQRRALAQKETEALARAARQQQALPGLFRQPGMAGGEAMPQEMGGVPMFSQSMGAAPMRQTPGGFDVQGAIAAGFTPEQITAYAGLQNIGRPKVARTVKGMGPDGREFEYQVDEFGQKVGDGMAQYRAPLSVNQGDRTTFADPYSLKPMGQFQTNQSPDSKASNAIAIRGQNMVDARAREANSAGKAPPGYRFKLDGALEAIPGGPADIKAGELGARQEKMKQGAVAQADRVVSKVDEALSKVGMTTTGLGSAMAAIPGTSARDLRSTLDTIKANLGFAELQAMRDASPTGGALGAIAVQELVALQSTVASLDQAQSQQQLTKSLDQIKTHYNNWKNTVQGGAQSGGATGGWSIKKVP